MESSKSLSGLWEALWSRLQRRRSHAFAARHFRHREQFRSNYEDLCRAINSTLRQEISTVLDIGSGNGFLIDGFLRLGVDVRGVEMSTEVRPFLSREALLRTTFADATSIGRQGHFDLVTCVEVAEHVPPGRSEALMDVLAGNTAKWLYFTAATPYQPGHGHINAQPHFYWLKGLRDRGLHLDYERTDELIKSIEDMEPCYWLPLNSLLLYRDE